jgi:hypothetical protein
MSCRVSLLPSALLVLLTPIVLNRRTEVVFSKGCISSSIFLEFYFSAK